MAKVVGVDPGLNGALCFLNSGTSIYFHEMPLIQNEINVMRLSLDIKEFKPDMVYLELASSRPGQSCVSTFTTGRNYGMILAALYLSGFPFKIVSPSTWAKRMHQGVDGKLKAKEKSKIAIQRLSPLGAALLAGKHDGKIDAYLIACYGLDDYSPGGV